MRKTLICSFIISAGLFLSASITANAETVTVNKPVNTTETTSIENVSNKVNSQDNKTHITTPVDNSTKQNATKDTPKVEENSTHPSTSKDPSIDKDSSIKNNSNKTTTESTLTINIVKETPTSNESKKEDTLSPENQKNETTDKTNINTSNEKTSKELLPSTKNDENSSNTTNNSAVTSNDDKITTDSTLPNENTTKKNTNELSNDNQKPNPITPDIPSIPELSKVPNTNLPDTAIIDFGDGTTSRLPINWLFINNSNVASLNILGNNYLFDYSIKDSFNEVNVVNTIVVTVTNVINPQFINTDGLPADYNPINFSNNFVRNNRLVKNDSSGRSTNSFKPQSLNQNKLSTVPKTYDYSELYLTLAFLIISCSSLLLLRFKKAA